MDLASILKLSLFLLIHSRWSFCTYNYTIDRTLITNFTDFNVNAFGYYQGLKLNNGDKIYRRHDSNSPYIDLISNTDSYPNYESFIIKLYNESDGIPIQDKMFDAIEVQITPKFDFNFQLVLNLLTSPSNDCKFKIDSYTQQWHWLTLWNFHVNSKGFLVGTVILDDIQKGKLCAVEVIDIRPLQIPITIVSFSFARLKVATEPDPPFSDDRFVWRNRTSLMNKNQPLVFTSFFAPDFLVGTVLEQEDLVRTVSVFSSSAGVGVFKMGSPVSCYDDDILNFNKPDCVLVSGKPRIYKESVFLQLDRGLDIASRFQTLVIIPLSKRSVATNAFSFSRSALEPDSFFHDRQIIDDFKLFINATLYRRNSVSGVLYKDDPTILGWSLGDLLESYYQSCPPTTWISEISEFIKSIDSNHLVILECWDENLDSLLVPEIDVILAKYQFDYYEASERASKLSKLIQKVFLVEFSYEKSNFKNTLKKCMDEMDHISGFLTSSLAGRSESNGFYGNRGLFFPGIMGTNEKVIMDLIRIIATNGTQTSRILNYAPRLLSLNRVQDTSFKFSWFGVVGAVSYDLYHAVGDGPFMLLASNLSEILSVPEYAIFNLPKPADCKNTTLFYRLYGIGEDKSMRSPPLKFNITLQSKYNNSYIQCMPAGFNTTANNNEAAVKSNDTILYIVISILASFCISAIITLYFIKKNISKKTSQLSKVSVSDIGIVGSKSTLFNLTDINDPAKKSFAPKIKVDLSKRTKGNGTSGHSQIIIYFDNENAASITINLTTSNEAYTLFVPGYLKFDWMLDFKQIKSLGKGATGTVYEAKVLNESFKSQHGLGDSNVAIKSMPFVRDDAFLFEVAIHRLISNHQNIVAFFGYFQGPNGMIMELCDGMLSELIFLNQKRFDQNFMKMETIMAAADDICRGCAHIHKHNIVHYDLKTANILFKRTADGIICKVADFGFSRLVNTNGSSSRNARLVNGLEMPNEIGYTVRYCAPEIFQSLTKSTDIHCTADHFKCDIYSFGIILYELLNGVKAWSDEGLLLEISDLVLAGKRPQIKDRFLRAKVEHNYSQDIVKMTSLIEQCWHQDPQSRPDFTSIIDIE